MELHITDQEAARMATELAQATGHSINEVVRNALRKEAKSIKPDVDQALYDDLMALADHCASLPDYDECTAERIFGYDENGLPT